MDKKKITNSKDLLMSSLSKFYSNKHNFNKIIPIIEGNSAISLRLIDWFVTNYSKKKNTIVTFEKNNNVIHFNVYLSYRSQLKAYSKQQFDPFRRRDRITFIAADQQTLETTIGQLNFFRWILQNDLLDYIGKNLEDIERDMIKTQKENTMKKKNEENIKVKEVRAQDGSTILQKRKKRNQLSKNMTRNMNLVNRQHTINFD
jgi:hypothetical protein